MLILLCESPSGRAIELADAALLQVDGLGTQGVATKAGSPLASRGVRGAPLSSRKRGHEPEAKPSACTSSWMAVASCESKSAAAEERAVGQKLTWPKMGRSYWSRWHVPLRTRAIRPCGQVIGPGHGPGRV